MKSPLISSIFLSISQILWCLESQEQEQQQQQQLTNFMDRDSTSRSKIAQMSGSADFIFPLPAKIVEKISPPFWIIKLCSSTALLQVGQQMNKNEKKIEFHRLAVVAFPMEHKCGHKANKAAAPPGLVTNTDTNNRIYSKNLGRKLYELQSTVLTSFEFRYWPRKLQNKY